MRSVAAELWDEWGDYPVGDSERDSQETAGLVLGLPLAVGKNTGFETVSLVSSRLLVLRRLMKLWRSAKWEARLGIASNIRIPDGMKGRVRVDLPRELYGEIVSYGRETWDWVRGLWGACGAFYAPRSGYYMVLRMTEAVSVRISSMLRRADVGGAWRGTASGLGKRELILRGRPDIVTLLSKMGFSDISLQLESDAVLRSVKSQANRERNCDTANIHKSLRAALKQTDLARRLAGGGVLQALPGPLRELAELRLENPDASLAELGKLLSPPVTKSTVKYRWGRLEVLAASSQISNNK
ncbi:putative sporulation transcription regulator WhiA [Synergistales bacterium]|nr:putative sporulation transcription regulator WhiA [Synergistales bacterium]